jgi:hypothetical protein
VLGLGDALDRETTARLLEHRADVAADQSDYAIQSLTMVQLVQFGVYRV